MHISSLHLWTYNPNTLINGTVEVSHDNVTTKIELSEVDRHRIQNIVVDAFLAERERIAQTILSNSPAFVALNAPEAEEAEYTSVDEEPF